MTYETGTATDLEDLLDKLDTFAQTTHGGWSSVYSPNPDTTNRWFELKKGSLSFGLKYPSGVGAGDAVSIHHATGSSSSATAPGAHTADSGNGYNDASGGSSVNFLTERCVSDMGNGPFPSYHFFADDTTNDYIHCVVQVESGTFRHFGFGVLDKFGDGWTGGEYVYGHYQNPSLNSSAVATQTSCFLDGIGTTVSRERGATIRIASGLPNQGAAVWGVAAPLPSASLLTDTAGNVRRQIHGGFRAGLAAQWSANVKGSGSTGLIPIIPIEAYYRDPVSTSRVYLLGSLADVGYLNIRNFAAEEEVTIGSDTWVIFPHSIRTEANIAGRTYYLGIAYKKVT